MKVGLRTLMTGKILRLGYLDNGCHGEQKTFPQLSYSIYCLEYVARRLGTGLQGTLGYWFLWQPVYFHGNQKIVTFEGQLTD